MAELSTNGERETIRARLLKVLRLAQEGVGGERENAEVLLGKLLRRHSMTMADLEGALDQPRTRVWLDASDVEERTVLAQLALRLFGTERRHWTEGQQTRLGIDVTPAEHVALTIAWEVYRPAFAAARRELMMGFCFKHSLFADSGTTAAEMTPEARASAARALALAEALPTVDAPARRLGTGD